MTYLSVLFSILLPFSYVPWEANLRLGSSWPNNVVQSKCLLPLRGVRPRTRASEFGPSFVVVFVCVCAPRDPHTKLLGRQDDITRSSRQNHKQICEHSLMVRTHKSENSQCRESLTLIAVWEERDSRDFRRLTLDWKKTPLQTRIPSSGSGWA